MGGQANPRANARNWSIDSEEGALAGFRDRLLDGFGNRAVHCFLHVDGALRGFSRLLQLQDRWLPAQAVRRANQPSGHSQRHAVHIPRRERRVTTDSEYSLGTRRRAAVWQRCWCASLQRLVIVRRRTPTQGMDRSAVTMCNSGKQKTSSASNMRTAPVISLSTLLVHMAYARNTGFPRSRAPRPASAVVIRRPEHPD